MKTPQQLWAQPEHRDLVGTYLLARLDGDLRARELTPVDEDLVGWARRRPACVEAASKWAQWWEALDPGVRSAQANYVAGAFDGILVDEPGHEDEEFTLEAGIRLVRAAGAADLRLVTLDIVVEPDLSATWPGADGLQEIASWCQAPWRVYIDAAENGNTVLGAAAVALAWDRYGPDVGRQPLWGDTLAEILTTVGLAETARELMCELAAGWSTAVGIDFPGHPGPPPKRDRPSPPGWYAARPAGVDPYAPPLAWVVDSEFGPQGDVTWWGGFDLEVHVTPQAIDGVRAELLSLLSADNPGAALAAHFHDLRLQSDGLVWATPVPREEVIWRLRWAAAAQADSIPLGYYPDADYQHNDFPVPITTAAMLERTREGRLVWAPTAMQLPGRPPAYKASDGSTVVTLDKGTQQPPVFSMIVTAGLLVRPVHFEEVDRDDSPSALRALYELVDAAHRPPPGSNGG